jgi:hypothetical protein
MVRALGTWEERVKNECCRASRQTAAAPEEGVCLKRYNRTEKTATRLADSAKDRPCNVECNNRPGYPASKGEEERQEEK